LRILYFDTSAILCWFFKEPGSKNVEKIYQNLYLSQGNYSFNCSKNTQAELYRKLEEKISNKHERIKFIGIFDKLFIIIEPFKNEGDEEKNDFYNNLILRYPNFSKIKNSEDSKIIKDLFVCLGIFAKESHPILISSDNEMCNVVKKEGYQFFNPKTMAYNDFLKMADESFFVG